jgi:uncharacterized protein DUF5658
MHRHSQFVIRLLICGALIALAPRAGAQEFTAESTDAPRIVAEVVTVHGTTPDFAAAVRPSLLASFAALQVLDTVSTLRGVSNGAREANPLMSGLVQHPAAFIAVKAMTTATTVMVLRGLAVKHPKTAFVLSAALNGAYSAIVVHNFKTASTLAR